LRRLRKVGGQEMKSTTDQNFPRVGVIRRRFKKRALSVHPMIIQTFQQRVYRPRLRRSLRPKYSLFHALLSATAVAVMSLISTIVNADNSNRYFSCIVEKSWSFGSNADAYGSLDQPGTERKINVSDLVEGASEYYQQWLNTQTQQVYQSIKISRVDGRLEYQVARQSDENGRYVAWSKSTGTCSLKVETLKF